MVALSRKLMGTCLMGTLPLVASAQVAVPEAAAQATPTKVEVGGTPTIDIITLRAIGPGAPLRFGNVVVGSERIQLDGRVLTPAQDYFLDHAAGVVYLKVMQKEGQTLTVSYRYKAKAADAKGFAAPSGITAFQYDVLPGSLSLLMGLGMAERGADGSVLSTNVFGWRNNVSLGSVKLDGLYVVGDRRKTDVQAGLSMDRGAKSGGEAATEEGTSRLILQSLSSSFLGGSATFSLQDIDEKFANFGNVRAAGYTDAQVESLAKERGLKRFGMSLKDVKVGSVGLSHNYRNVEDKDGSIEWRSFGLASGGAKLNWSSQRVSNGFNRFNDIAEADRQQLMKEKGMSRDTLSAEFASRTGKLSFDSSRIVDDATGKEIVRRTYGIDTGKIKFNLGQQEVDTGFARFASLLGPEQATYGREAGIKRQWMGLQASILGAGTPLTFNQTRLGSDKGRFLARDISAGNKTWSLQHSSRSVSKDFTSLGAMSEPEMDGHIRTIGNMYGPGVGTRPEDRGAFLGARGLDRTYTRFFAEPFKSLKVSFDRLTLQGKDDRGQVDTLSIAAKSGDFTYRRQHLGQKFGELASLMEFERARLGPVSGLDRTDMSLALRLGGHKRLTLGQTAAETKEGGAKRFAGGYTDKKIDISFAAREVDSAFNAVTNLVDAEKDLLVSLRGFEQRDAKIKWDILPGLKLDAFLFDASNADSKEQRMLRDISLNWNPNGRTSMGYVHHEQRSDDPLSTLFANVVERMGLSHDFGRFGKFALVDEKVSYDGKDGTQPDSHKRFFSYETKLDSRTSLRTEQTRTSYENGEKEDIRANTVSTELTKRLGVSVTDVKTDRKGDERDERRRDYGVWFDFGNGFRVSYGYARHLNGEEAGTESTTLTFGQNAQRKGADQVGTVQDGTLGNLRLGGGYGENQWETKDGNRTQAFSNFRLSTVKPFNFGFLKDVRLNFGHDSAADYEKWLRENRVIGASARVGPLGFAYEYRSQMDAQEHRAIDRTVKLTTDKSLSNWLSASVFYKARTLPDGEKVMIRNFDITAKPLPNLSITHGLITNPELPKSDALLGSVPQPAHVNKWSVDYRASGNFTLGATWEEKANEQSNTMTRLGGLNLEFFARSGSPIKLFYGVEQSDTDHRRTVQRYHLQFDQRPGPNQTFSFFVGNVSYQHHMDDNLFRNNWTFRMDYQLRF